MRVRGRLIEASRWQRVRDSSHPKRDHRPAW
jgi:hypothetical protein